MAGLANHTEPVLVLIDFKPPSIRALKYALSLAGVLKSPLHLLHLCDLSEQTLTQPPSLVDAACQPIHAKLKALVEMVEVAGVQASYAVGFGEPISKLAKELNYLNPSLVLLGGQPDTAQQMGSISMFLLNNYTGCFLVVNNDTPLSRQTSVLMDISICKQQDYPSKLLNLLAKEWHTSAGCIETNRLTLKKLKKHIKATGIGLFCVHRSLKEVSVWGGMLSHTNYLKHILLKLEIPVLVMGRPNYDKNAMYDELRI